MSAPDEPTPAPAPPPAHSLGTRWRTWWQLRRQRTELRWSALFRGVQRASLVTQVLLLHVRYTCGYLATGFLVSAPIQLIGASHGEWDEGRIWKSMLLGGLFGLPFLALIPFTNVDWGRMRIPEFKHLELAFCRWAVWVSLGLMVLALLIEAVSGPGALLDRRVAWVNLVLMFFAWVRVKANMVMFREFYTLKPGDELVISLPLGYERPDLSQPPPEGASPTGAAPPEPTQSTAEPAPTSAEPAPTSAEPTPTGAEPALTSAAPAPASAAPAPASAAPEAQGRPPPT